jgi:hypothetical protein
MTRPLLLILSALAVAGSAGRVTASDEEKIRLTLSGGHVTDARDRGRPVVLIAHALGVTPDVFRDAFSHVHPAPRGVDPDPAEVRRNKAALLGALASYGVTNDLLDRVSDYYRYPPGSDRLWPTKPATAYVTMTGGAVGAVTVVEPGSGYSSLPEVLVPGHPEIALKATLAFGRDLGKNGAVASISLDGSANRGR